MGTFTGVSPLLAEEARLRARPPLTAESLWFGLNDILTCVRLNEYDPRVWADDAGATLGAYPVPLLSVPARNQFPRSSISVALDNATASSVRRDTFTHTRDALQAALHKALRARLREQEEVGKGLANADRAEEYQQSGELLLSQPHTPRRCVPGGAAGLLRAAPCRGTFTTRPSRWTRPRTFAPTPSACSRGPARPATAAKDWWTAGKTREKRSPLLRRRGWTRRRRQRRRGRRPP